MEDGRHLARLHRRRRRRAHEPGNNTASHDNYEKINSWVSFSYLYGYEAFRAAGARLLSSVIADAFLVLAGILVCSHSAISADFLQHSALYFATPCRFSATLCRFSATPCRFSSTRQIFCDTCRFSAHFLIPADFMHIFCKTCRFSAPFV